MSGQQDHAPHFRHCVGMVLPGGAVTHFAVAPPGLPLASLDAKCFKAGRGVLLWSARDGRSEQEGRA